MVASTIDSNAEVDDSSKVTKASFELSTAIDGSYR